jgi:hypothetical protein
LDTGNAPAARFSQFLFNYMKRVLASAFAFLGLASAAREAPRIQNASASSFAFPGLASPDSGVRVPINQNASAVREEDSYYMKKVKNEGEVYSFIGSQKVFFGCLTAAAFDGGVNCDLSSFNDPCYQVTKSCWWLDDSTGEVNFCAEEGKGCFFAGQKTIYFGAFNSLWLTDGTMCTIDVFGDPAYKVTKACFIVPKLNSNATH